jgi:gamma-glutamyltranspeptidase/glutathione hydrolase
MPEAKRFPQAGVATPHYLASAAGLESLARGGNAMDAVIAANLALGVVAPYLCGYGGDVFAIVWDGELHGYLGSGCSGRGDTLDRVAAEHETMPVLGGQSVTVPGAPAGWFALLERWGTRSFADLAGPARRYASDGFAISEIGRESFDGCRALYADFADWMRAYGEATSGRVLRQPALTRTIDALASDGPDAYYRGPIADAIATAVQAGGGTLAAPDLAAHAGRWGEPLRASYRDVEVAELPPPTQGVTALEGLRILDGVDLPPDGLDRQHLMIEAMKLALSDRDAFVTDPAAMRVAPGDLLTDAFVAGRRTEIDIARASAPTPGRAQTGGTAYLCAADGDGLLVSLIQSNFLAFGSGVHVPEWGINLNNRASSFTLDPERANTLAPSKLPMHTLIPAMALRDGQPWLVFGSMGADAQAQVHVQLLARMVDDGDDSQVAIDAPRWRVEPQTWQLLAEPRFDAAVIDGLRARGHDVRTTRPFDLRMGHAHAIELRPDGYGIATDPRAEGAALGI